jgi:drug/metabolite transporter (DMT)-like permease
MAFSNFTSGKLNRYGAEIWIANNTFQYLLTFLLSQIIIMTYPNPNEQKKDSPKSESNTLLKFFKLDNDICPLWIYIVIGAQGVIASLLICLSLRNTSITYFAMIYNTICLVNLIISALTLERKFHA